MPIKPAVLCLTLLGVVACHDDKSPAPDSTGDPVSTDDAGTPADAPTYWQDMAPLFAAHCVGCHQTGGIAPFRLDDYAMAKSYAPVIRTATAAREMPPWGVTSDGSCGEFKDSEALDDAQIALIDAWVAGGAVEGEPATIAPPEKPSLADAVAYPTPDFLPEPQGGELSAHDEYRCFALDPGVTADSFITGYEVTPGEPAIVHHVLLMLVDPAAPAEDPMLGTNGELMAALDAKSPDRDGWECFSGAGDGVAVESNPVVWAPGQGVVEYPNESGVPISPRHKVVIQVHYNLFERHGLRDSSTVKLRIVDQVKNVGLFLLIDPLLGSLEDDQPHTLEAGKASVKYTWKQSMAELDADSLPGLALYGVMPHMHQLGHKYRMTVHQGDQPSCAADVQGWDFHWQRLYFYDQPYPLTNATSIEVTCDFDTSSRTEPIMPGWGTQNEMCLATLYLTVPLSSLR
jgi:mono/diheme cytochrome c family protein